VTQDKTGIYLPSEDTATLARVLRSYRGGGCLEIGFGSGALLQSLSPRFGTIVGTDLVSVAQARAARGDAEVVLADRATCFRERTFDLVTFNPPYLPSETIEDRTVDGGKGGLQVPFSFLEEALRVLKPEGSVVLLLSDEADLNEFKTSCERKGLRVEEKARESLFFENLFVFEVSRLPRG
jgi:release factor glutamine methyltransferase